MNRLLALIMPNMSTGVFSALWKCKDHLKCTVNESDDQNESGPTNTIHCITSLYLIRPHFNALCVGEITHSVL